MNSTPVNLVIFTSREELATLIETTTCALAAVPQSSTIDVVVNGNKANATAMRQWLATHEPERSLTVHVWLIDAPDKGNAWNQHVHTIWRDDCHAIHIDGYVRIDAASVAAMISTLASNPSALGTSAVPGMGRSAEALRKMTLEQGGFHGGLCAIEVGALRTMRQRGICVPRGLYRVDGLVGAILYVRSGQHGQGLESEALYPFDTGSGLADRAQKMVSASRCSGVEQEAAAPGAR